MTGEEHRVQWVIILDVVVILWVLIGGVGLLHVSKPPIAKNYPPSIVQTHGEK